MKPVVARVIRLGLTVEHLNRALRDVFWKKSSASKRRVSGRPREEHVWQVRDIKGAGISGGEKAQRRLLRR